MACVGILGKRYSNPAYGREEYPSSRGGMLSPFTELKRACNIEGINSITLACSKQTP